MKDFNLAIYYYYLKLIKLKFKNILTFEDIFNLKSYPNVFCILRHDVDRFPFRALNMAILENRLGFRSSYYFRAKYVSFDSNIIKKIKRLGHEVGYHYECLSDSRGDMDWALQIFKNNLEKFRKIVPIKTISMHGKPMSEYDNRDMWQYTDFHQRLKNEFNILGEIYLDVDYSNIAYITDAGRNWNCNENNIRDKVASNVQISLSDSNLVDYIRKTDNRKLILSTHPERWPMTYLGYLQSRLTDDMTNIVKKIIF